jgi:hypothetical protein
MGDAETIINLAEHEAAVAAFLVEHNGRLARDPDDRAIYWLDLRPRSAPDERFYPRIVWRSYPHAAPSVAFADGIRGMTESIHAWPQIAGYRAPVDICKPFTAEGFALHPEWNKGPDAWPTDGNPFLWIVETLQYDLDHGYNGRAG